MAQQHIGKACQNREVNETYLEVEVCLTFYRPRAPTKVKWDRRHPISFHPSKALTIMILWHTAKYYCETKYYNDIIP